MLPGDGVPRLDVPGCHPVPAERPDEAVEGQRQRPDQLREPAGRIAHEQLDLEVTVGGGDEALGEEQVVDAGGVDVGDSPAVPADLHRLPQPPEPDLALHRGKGLPGRLLQHQECAEEVHLEDTSYVLQSCLQQIACKVDTSIVDKHIKIAPCRRNCDGFGRSGGIGHISSDKGSLVFAQERY